MPSDSTPTSIAQRLAELGIELPASPAPAAAYVSFVITGKLAFVSGHIARRGGTPWVGQLGDTLTLDEGKAAARGIGIELLGTLRNAAGGDLENVARIVKVMCLVNSTATFTDQHLVANGCSDLLNQVMGERGVHARSAFGVAQIPMGACVEIELIAELR